MGELDIFCPATGTERGRGLIRMSHGCNLMEHHRKLATLTRQTLTDRQAGGCCCLRYFTFYLLLLQPEKIK